MVVKKDMILAGDIGGTKTDIGLFTMGAKRPIKKTGKTYSSKEAAGLEDIIQSFLQNNPVHITHACFGIAGPIIDGKCKTTNLPWDVSETDIEKQFKWDNVKLINDLEAMALSIPLLTSRELFSLNRKGAHRGTNLALIAPGTGLGQALLFFRDEAIIPISSEGGHVDFGPNNEKEVELWKYLHGRYGHVSIERILSGSGLVNIYSWLRSSAKQSEPNWLKKLFKSNDPARVISEVAIENRDPHCREALDTYISILGAAAGNLALTGLSTGGVYLGGGIPPKILPELAQGLFIQSFTNKGRFKDLLEKIPVRVILHKNAALLGAASCAYN